MASGAKGVSIWSLSKRTQVRRTWQLCYDAYSECAGELNGELGLSQVFLFGERTAMLSVQPAADSEDTTVTLGGEAEVTTTTEQEREQRKVEVPSWTAAEYTCDGRRWLFLINSANTPAAFGLGALSPGSEVSDVFSGQRIDIQPDRPCRLQLPACGVCAIRWVN